MQPNNQPGGSEAPTPQPVVQPTNTPVVQPQAQPATSQPAQAQATAPAESAPVEFGAAIADAAAEQQGFYVQQEGAEGQYDDEGYGEEEIDLSEPVSWKAQEYIHQEKGAMWFAAFAVVVMAFIGFAIFVKAWLFIPVIIAIVAVVIISAKRPPRVMDYSLSNEGLHIGETLHKFSDFKSFGIIHDGKEFSVMLMPRRRLQPGIAVYFPEESGEAIVDALGSRLPMRELRLDIIDELVRMLRL